MSAQGKLCVPDSPEPQHWGSTDTPQQLQVMPQLQNCGPDHGTSGWTGPWSCCSQCPNSLKVTQVERV